MTKQYYSSVEILITCLIIIICILAGIKAYAGIRTYIIYEKNKGKIINTGHVNLERDLEWIAGGDNSTVYSSILNQLDANNTLDILYKPEKKLPVIKIKKIDLMNKTVIDKTQTDLYEEEKEKKIQELQQQIDYYNKVLNAQNALDVLQSEINALQN